MMERISGYRLAMIVNGTTEDATSEVALARQTLTAEHAIREIQAGRLRWVQKSRWVEVKYAGAPSEEWSDPTGELANYLNDLEAETDEAAATIASWFR